MNQLWLRTLIGDPQTKTVLRRQPQHPLPVNLRVSQLRSYLEQRFGPPVAEHVAGESWMEFENPDPSPEAQGTHLIAIPLIADPRTQELVPVFEKLEQFADLAAAFGTARPGGKSTEASRIWVGPLFNHRHLFQQINDLAAQAARALLLGEGLRSEIDKVIEANLDNPIFTAGLSSVMRELDEFVTLAVHAADSAMLTHRRATDLAAEIESRHDASAIDLLHSEERRFVAGHDNALGYAQQSERLTREIAQLAFGISACASAPLSLVERLDRAAVAVLHPPRGTGRAVPLRDDGLAFRATSKPDLMVELAGVICRMLIDRDTVVSLLLPDRESEGIYMEIEEGDTLMVSAHTGFEDTRRHLLASSGWTEEEPGIFVQRWPSPVRAVIPATVIAQALLGPLGLEDVEALKVAVGASRDASVQFRDGAEPGENGGVM